MVLVGNECFVCGGLEYVGIDRGKRGMMFIYIDIGVIYYLLLKWLFWGYYLFYVMNNKCGFLLILLFS